MHLIKLWLKAPVIGEDDQGTKRHVGGGKGNRRGTPQGGVISPLLANCYLHVLDRIWEKHRLRAKLKAHIVRYADDFVVLCGGGVDEPLAAVRHVLDRLGLTLNEAKTHVVDAREESFNFLGFALRMSKSWKSGKCYPHVCPSAKSLAKIKGRITQLTARERTPIPIAQITASVNTTLRGWVGYFHYRNCARALAKVQTHTEDRIRTHLMKRHRVKDWGSGLLRFPRSVLYTRYGLYKVPTTAGWTTAHALV